MMKRDGARFNKITNITEVTDPDTLLSTPPPGFQPVGDEVTTRPGWRVVIQRHETLTVYIEAGEDELEPLMQGCLYLDKWPNSAQVTRTAPKFGVESIVELGEDNEPVARHSTWPMSDNDVVEDLT